MADAASIRIVRDLALGVRVPLSPRQVFVVHGEPQAAQALAETLRGRLGWNAAVARDGETVSLRAE
ncbi:MAG: MBL fold metallo-hydrolase RNA specificity domain-containing protein [Candidatus Binatia bacterium]